MIEEVLNYLHNYFPDKENAMDGDFTIANGSITPSGVLKPRQYYLIRGSTFNDGVHQFEVDSLIDEEFAGIMIPMTIPAALLEVVADMETWETDNPDGLFQSENLSGSGYSYTRATGSATGTIASVYDRFAPKLKRWKKI